MAVNPGSTLGQYELVEELGRGGMAVVFKAYQRSLDRHVAVKVLPAFYADDPSFVDRFRAEATAVARLRHPNILTIYDFGQQEGVYFIVMEYVAGGTLAQRLGKPLSPEQTLSFMRPLASALDYAHARGILHRDIKPGNVLLSSDDEPILSDFGLARMMEGTARLTRTGLTVGTPEYMSPEQAMGRSVGPASDLYALAIICYEMLTGTVPYRADTPVAVVLAHLNDTPPSPRTINPSLSEAVEAVLLKGLAKQPEDRFLTATEMATALQTAASEPATACSAAAEAPLPAAEPTPDMVVAPAPNGAQLAGVEASKPPSRPALNQLEFHDEVVDLTSHNLPYSAGGFDRGVQVLNQRLAPWLADGWELMTSLTHPSIYTQARSLRGPIIRTAVIPMKRLRRTE